ncbi:MAG: hypothetical protein M1838_002414 [Thelocarpon superellum]|nr:MAG: hypothetical protein M1838_002414 [Thelocarpon superellum]
MCGNASAPLTPCQFPVDQGYAEGIELGPPNDFTYFVAHGDGTLLLNTSNVNGPNKQQVTIGEDLSLQYNVGIVGAGGSTSSDGGQGTSGGWQSQSVSPTPGAGWKIPVLIPPTNVMNAQGLNFLACPVPDPGSGSKYYKLYVSHNVASPAPAVAARQVSGPILGPRPGLAPTFDVTACYSVALDIIGPGPLDRFVVPVAYD